jgi:membrane associated rhomboid family serine protease
MKKQKYRPFVQSTLFVLLLWAIKSFEVITDIDLSQYGIYPRTAKGLIGIITCPLIHADYGHLWANSLSLIVLGTILLSFYKDIAASIFFWIYFATGIWVWIAARSSYHIGASGIVYGLETFLFFSGVFRKNGRLMALSLLVVFLYGSSIWGIFPLQRHISWESHALGALAGLVIAYYFKNEGPPNPTYNLGDDEENEILFKEQNELLANNQETAEHNISVSH